MSSRHFLPVCKETYVHRLSLLAFLAANLSLYSFCHASHSGSCISIWSVKPDIHPGSWRHFAIGVLIICLAKKKRNLGCQESYCWTTEDTTAFALSLLGKQCNIYPISISILISPSVSVSLPCGNNQSITTYEDTDAPECQRLGTETTDNRASNISVCRKHRRTGNQKG